MAAQRFSVYDNKIAVPPRPPRRIFQQLLLVSALACVGMGVMHIEPRLSTLQRLWR